MRLATNVARLIASTEEFFCRGFLLYWEMVLDRLSRDIGGRFLSTNTNPASRTGYPERSLARSPG
jgi:hypothetical protein